MDDIPSTSSLIPSPNSLKLCKVKRKSSNEQTSFPGKKLALDERLSSDAMDTQETSTLVTDWISQFHEMPDSVKLDALSNLVDTVDINGVRLIKSKIEPFFQKDFISLLPRELAMYVLSMLSPVDLSRASRVCHYWMSVTEDHLLWKEKCEEEGVQRNTLPDPKHRPTPGDMFTRSPWKATYLRLRRVNHNWRCSEKVLKDCRYLKGHDEHVITCLKICGDKIISGSDDSSLRVWSTNTAQCLLVLSGHTGGVWSSQVSKDGKIVVSGSTDRTVKIWCMKTGKCLHTLNGHTSTVRCLALHGTTLVSGSRDTTLRVWDVETGNQLRLLNGHVAAVRCVQYDGVRIVSGAYDYTVKVWDVASGLCMHSLCGHTNRVYSLLLDSARDIVVSGSLDMSMRVWNVRTGACLHTLMGHQSLTSGMQLKGNILVSGNADSSIKVWDMTDGQCLHTLNRHHSAVTSVQLLDNGLVVSSSDDGTVKLWDAKRGTLIRDLISLNSQGRGGCVWRLKATPTTLVAAVGSRNNVEDTKLVLFDFSAQYPTAN